MIQKQIIEYDNYEVYNKLNYNDLKKALNEAKIRLEKKKTCGFFEFKSIKKQ